MSEKIREQVDEICKLLCEKKALDVMAIHVADKTVIADWFIICSGRVPAQTKALCDEVQERAEALGLTMRRCEGYRESRWIVLDYADILVHIFLPEERRYYNMERLWDEHNEAVRYGDAGE